MISRTHLLQSQIKETYEEACITQLRFWKRQKTVIQEYQIDQKGLEQIENSDRNENQGELQDMFGVGADIEPARSQTMLYYYNVGLYILPQGQKLPDMTFVQFITMWLCGDRTKGIPPLRLLQITHLKYHIPRAKHVLCAMRYLMKAVERQVK